MNLLKIIILCLLSFHFDSFADSWFFTVNGSELQCEGDKKDRFWLCKGSYYSGLIDRKPENEELKFLPMLMSAKGIELDLDFESWTTLAGDNALGEETLYFSYRDYFDFNILSLEKELQEFPSKSPLPKNSFTIVVQAYRYIGLIQGFFKALQNRSFHQEIYEENKIIFSWFIPTEPAEIKKSDTKIDCLGKEILSLENQAAYRDISFSSNGRNPTLAEANGVFKFIAQRTDLPFNYFDGCYARAHVIGNELFTKGLSTGKVWLAGKLWNPREPSRQWNYHVAPILVVKAPDNKIATVYVVDPTVDPENLLTIYEWLEKFSISTIKRVSFPIAPESEYFEDVVMAFSSHIPMWPFQYDGAISLSETLREADDINATHLRLLKNQ